jgi:hypothetical protein
MARAESAAFNGSAPEFLQLLVGWLDRARDVTGRANRPGERDARRDDQSVFQAIAKGGVTFQGPFHTQDTDPGRVGKFTPPLKSAI